MSTLSGPIPLMRVERLAGAMRLALQTRVDTLAPIRARLAAMVPDGPLTRYEELKVFDAPGGAIVLRSNLVSRDDDGTEGGIGHIAFHLVAGGPGVLDRLSQHAPVAAIHRLDQVLWRMLGEGLRLRCHRETYRVSRAEVHLDQVLKLGQFAQIEIAVDLPDDAEAAREEAAALGARLGIERGPSMIEAALSRKLRSSVLDLAL